MRCNSFTRSAMFAALAAMGWLPWALIATPICGVWHARALYLGAVTVLYVAGLSPQNTRRLMIAVLVSAATAALTLVVRNTTELCIGLAVLLGVARSVFLYRATPARAVTTEAGLLLGGLLFAAFLARPSLPSTALALWGFLLVQSSFFLVGGVHVRSATLPQVDPFEEAHRRAVALLERLEV